MQFAVAHRPISVVGAADPVGEKLPFNVHQRLAGRRKRGRTLDCQGMSLCSLKADLRQAPNLSRSADRLSSQNQPFKHYADIPSSPSPTAHLGKVQLGTGFVKAVALVAARGSGHSHLARPSQSGRSITNQLASKSPLMALLTMAPNSITPMCNSINHHKFDVATYAIVKASADTTLPTNCFGVLNPCAAPYARAAMMIAPNKPILAGR